MSSVELLNQLLQELDTLEVDINRLIELSATNLSVRSLLDTKLSDLATSVEAIPPEKVSLLTIWRKRLDILKVKHLEVISSRSSQKINELNHADFITQNKFADCGDNNNNVNQFSHNSGIRSVKMVEIISKIKSAFKRESKFVRSVNDHHGIRILLPLMGKARRLLDHSFPDRQDRGPLYSEVFTLAYEKLCSDLQSKCEMYKSDQMASKNLNGLILLLCQHYREILEAAEASRESNDLNLLFNCTYCHVVGHHNYSCPSIKSMFCLNCFQFGHERVRCPNDAFPPEDIFT